ncbi:MAG: cryptochrome/photolyase family protein [Methylacidiphilales bacterium]|nr:cryptochrome/photolyase family protein [Candidatus Methylacidiphilales bacterium]
MIFPHQLFWPHPCIQAQQEACPTKAYLVEEILFFRQYPFHKHKLLFHLASLSAFKAKWEASCSIPIYRICSHDERSDVRALIPYLSKQGVGQILTIEPDDDWLKQRLVKTCLAHAIAIRFLPNPALLTSHEQNEALLPLNKKPFQTDYYIAQRKRLHILLEANNKPTGGSWTYDTSNRLKLPHLYPVPPYDPPGPSRWVKECIPYLEKHFPQSPGNPDEFCFAVTHSGARRQLEAFLEKRLHDFGPYEDAIEPGHDFLFHSVLTPYLNVGLLTPREVIQATLERHRKQPVPLNSLEGFIRQIIGWREFMRAVYHLYGRRMRTTNFWNFTRPLPKAFYSATTGILPVDDAIRKVLRLAYAHHIERLMVLGNFMLLCEIHPDAVYRWFMELFIDAYDWVMVPNVYGMSQFADGGLITTKPYISSSNYILKMSSYRRDPAWTEPWDALFWRFVDKQRAFFQGNPRLSMLLKTYDRMPQARRRRLQEVANNYLQKLHS